jgi:catechol 2,3-dioxygenase-like lactoylglutathione lyase family enzyme
MSVHSLLSYALEVPDVEIGLKFYTDFGLDMGVAAPGRVALRCHGRSRDQVVLLRGGEPRKRLHHVELGASSEGIEAIQRRLRDREAPVQGAPVGFEATGVWLHDANGVLLHVVECNRDTGLPIEAPFVINSPGHQVRVGRPAVPPRNEIGPVRPRRLGHVLIFTQSVERSIEFYGTVLGLRLSDRSGEGIAFMHCAGGSEHHVIALAKSRGSGFHHASFEVGTPDEVGLGGSRMTDKGYGPNWGFGRHAIGSNFFWYIRDPWNSYAEYYCDMDYIPAEADWRARDWAPEDSLHSWGPNPPEDFVKNYEAEL